MDLNYLTGIKLCYIYKTGLSLTPRAVEWPDWSDTGFPPQKKPLTTCSYQITCQQNDNRGRYIVCIRDCIFWNEPSNSSQDTKLFYSYDRKIILGDYIQAIKCSFILTLDHRRENQIVVYYFQKKSWNRVMNCYMSCYHPISGNLTDNLIPFSHIRFYCYSKSQIHLFWPLFSDYLHWQALYPPANLITILG